MDLSIAAQRCHETLDETEGSPVRHQGAWVVRVDESLNSRVDSPTADSYSPRHPVGGAARQERKEQALVILTDQPVASPAP